MSHLLASFDAILSDLDGVVYAGPDPIPGAVPALNRAQREGAAVAYVTNNASRSVGTVAEHLNVLGLHTDAEHVVSSAQAAARLAADRLGAGAPVQICGAEALADCARDAGLRVVAPGEEPRAVLQGFEPTLRWQDLAEAAYTLADEQVLWIASNTDLTIPKERGIAPGNGTLVRAVATATRREPLVAGKPGAAIFHTIVERLDVRRPLVVGDRLDTDILGAHRADLPSAAVMTGVQTWEDVLRAPADQRPDHLLADLGELFEDYAAPRVNADGGEARAELHGITAQADAAGVTVRGDGPEVLRWRVACAAWWAVHPRAEEPTEPELRWR